MMQPLDSETALIKISHCKKDIFFPYVPKYCPLCGQSVSYRRLEEAPVSIPSPFVNGHREKCSFLLKPTSGTFLRDYDGNSDLHVGITSTNDCSVAMTFLAAGDEEERSPHQAFRLVLEKALPALHIAWQGGSSNFAFYRMWLSLLLLPDRGSWIGGTENYGSISMLHDSQQEGMVYNYNETGINRGEHGWEQCINIPLVQPDMCALVKQWDTYLEQFSAPETWLPHRYEEHGHNCYTYALAFINCVLSAQGKQQISKSEFTEKFVIPRTRKASKYITVYKEICKNGFYVVDRLQQENDNATGSHLL